MPITADNVSDKRIHYVLLGLLTLVAFAFRLYQLGTQSFWLDETFSYYAGSQPDIVSVINVAAQQDNHPPLYYLILHGWMPLAGTTEFAIRFVSAVAGTLSIALVAKLGARLFNERIGYIAAALLLVSPFHIWYSQEARMYALVCLMAIGSVLLYLRCQRDQTFKTSVAYVCVTVLMLSSHYYGFFVLLFENIAFVTMRREGLSLKRWLVMQTAVAALFSPWLLGIVQQFRRAPRDYDLPVGLLDVLRNLNVTFSVGEAPAMWIEPVHWGFLLVFVLAIATHIWAKKASDKDDIAGKHGLGFSLLFLLGTPIIAYLMSSALSMNLRAGLKIYYIVILPAYILVLAWSVNKLTQYVKVLGIMVFVFLFAASLTSIADQFYNRGKEDFRSIVSYVSAREAPEDAIVLNAEHIFTAFSYYYKGILSWNRAEVSDEEGTAAFLRRVTEGKEGAWLVLSRDELADPKGLVRGWFGGHGSLISEQWLFGGRVLYFSLEPRPNFRPPNVPSPLNINATFANNIKLTGYGWPSETKSGGLARVKLFWQSLAKPADDYRVVTYLEDSAGRVSSQLDRIPFIPSYGPSKWVPGEYLTDNFYFPIELGTPPGTYNVKVRLYSPASGITLKPDGINADSIPIGQLKVLTPSASETARALNTLGLSPRRDLNDDVTLLQWKIGQKEVMTGEKLSLSLLWQARRKPQATYDVILQVVGEGDAVLQEVRSPILGGHYPTIAWESGEVVRDYEDLILSNNLKAGNYRIRVRLVRSDNDQTTRAVDLDNVAVHSPERSFELPKAQYPYDIDLGAKISFLGYDIPNERLAPGGKLKLFTYWKGQREMPDSYKLFIHLLGPGNTLIAQQDSIPLKGLRPTTSWATGEVIKDEHELLLPADAPLGDYRLELGFYDPVSGQRLAISDGGPKASDNAVLLREPIVVESR